jgi:integral membrane protein (TIGR01906 family)
MRKQTNAVVILFIILFVLSVPLMLLLTDVQMVTFDRDYYRNEYAKYGIPEHIGMSMDNLMDSTDKLLQYMDNERQDLNFKASFIAGEKEFFSERDKLHMVDVKGLFMKGFLIRNSAFIFVVGFLLLLFRKKPFKERLRSLACYGIAVSAVGIIPVLILVILMNIDFYKYFTIFHEIFFTNDLWLMDLATDRLVNIFPQDFFTDMAFSISYYYIAEMALILAGSILVLKFVKGTSDY